MKRFFALILVATMMFTLVACGNSAPGEAASEGESKTTNSTTVQTEPTAPVDATEPDSSQADDTAQAEQTEGGSAKSRHCLFNEEFCII